MSIYKKLSEFQSKVEAVKKKATNPHFKSKYASLDGVLEVIKEPLREVGLTFTQIPRIEGLETVIADIEDGTNYIKGTVPYLLTKNDMQGLGSAITYARRYALVSMLGLEQEDDDGNKACEPKTQTHEVKAPTPTPTKPVAPLKQYLLDNGFSLNEIATFYTKHNITTVEAATKVIGDKAALTELIKEFKRA